MGSGTAVYLIVPPTFANATEPIRDIDLYSKRSITIQIGTPLSSIPTWDWTNAGYTH